jgi:hypothetical protein
MTRERAEQLDVELRSTRARIAGIQDLLGTIHRDRSGDLRDLASKQQGLLAEMAQAQQRLNDLDNERRGFGPLRRP